MQKSKGGQTSAENCISCRLSGIVASLHDNFLVAKPFQKHGHTVMILTLYSSYTCITMWLRHLPRQGKLKTALARNFNVA